MSDTPAKSASRGLGRAITVRRADLGLKRKDLAKESSLSYPYISELENGGKEPSAKALRQIADALDMGADASVYALSLAAVGTAAARKKQLARASGYLQLGLASIGLIEVTRRFVVDTELPDPTSMIVVSALALAGNVVTLVVLRRVRSGEAHLQASWIFTANDIKVNALVIAAAVGVVLTDSAVPDLVAGAVIFVVVANGARRILGLSR
jgi:Co/Zn/Cd efflux system component